MLGETFRPLQNKYKLIHLISPTKLMLKILILTELKVEECSSGPIIKRRKIEILRQPFVSEFYLAYFVIGTKHILLFSSLFH